MNKLIIIIPAYNEERNIAKVIQNLPHHINGIDYIVCVVIDDGSTDETARVAKENGVNVVGHIINKGVGTAISSGLDYALTHQADMVVNIDADGQFDPQDISKLIKPIVDGHADFVTCNRFFSGRPKNMPLIKYWGNKIMNGLIGFIAGKKFSDVSCGFRAYNRKALLRMNLFGKYTYTQESFLDLCSKNLNHLEVPLEVKYFKDRKSKLANNLFKYTYKTINIIIRSVVYYKPLKFFGYPGIFLLFIGFFFVAFLLLHKLVVGSYSPYKAFGFIGSSMMLFGLLMVFIGLVADVIDRVRQNQEKLLYFEKKRMYYKK